MGIAHAQRGGWARATTQTPTAPGWFTPRRHSAYGGLAKQITATWALPEVLNQLGIHAQRGGGRNEHGSKPAQQWAVWFIRPPRSEMATTRPTVLQHPRPAPSVAGKQRVCRHFSLQAPLAIRTTVSIHAQRGGWHEQINDDAVSIHAPAVAGRNGHSYPRHFPTCCFNPRPARWLGETVHLMSAMHFLPH